MYLFVYYRAGVGVYNADFEKYLYCLVQSSPSTRQSLQQVQDISSVPATMEFEEEEFRRQNSFRSPPSPTPSNDSTECEQDLSKGLGPRARAQTYGFKIRTRVGSSVSKLSRVVLNEAGSPAVKRKLSTRRKNMSSPQLPRKQTQEDAVSRNSTCSSASDLSMDKIKQQDCLKEEPQLEEMESVEKGDSSTKTIEENGGNEEETATKMTDGVEKNNGEEKGEAEKMNMEDAGEAATNAMDSEKPDPAEPVARKPSSPDKPGKSKLKKSAKSSAAVSNGGGGKKKPTHKRTRSSDQVIELEATDIQLNDITIAVSVGSASKPNSPIDWEALGEAEKVGGMCNLKYCCCFFVFFLVFFFSFLLLLLFFV